MIISFLGQGLNSSGKSVGSVLINSFSDAEFNKFSCLVAFASKTGIDGISEAVKSSKQHIKQFRVVVGIDQNGTSKEALEALLKLEVGTSVYYTISHIIFHPKIYLFEGKKKCLIILGSSNLTERGLCQNIEGSLIIDVVKPDKEGEKLLKQIYDYFESFFEGENKNIHELTQELIKKLLEFGKIPDESERQKLHDNKNISQKESELKTLFPSIEFQKLPSGFKTTTVIKDKTGGNTGTKVRYWKVSPGVGAENWEECKENSCISIGWTNYKQDWRQTEYGDLTKNQDKEKIMMVLRKYYPEATGRQVSKYADIIIKFFEIKPGDKIIAYDKKFHINAIGEVKGEYDFKYKLDYPHIKKVKWLRIFDKPLDIRPLKNQLTKIWLPPTVIEMTEKDWNTIDSYSISG